MTAMTSRALDWARPLMANRDLALGVAVMAIIAMLVLPLRPWMLDLGLALSITLSVMILMTALFIERPLDLSAFPTILLISTLLRLGLNIASTRLILGHGHEGVDAAGGVIAAFGEFMIGGEIIIGLTIFLILIVINFIVITKGAGRIAEVAARFSLDSMPGKQMAIDADLSAGLIDEGEARRRREEIEAESGFFGAMDGASKFVKGDAVAALLITAINILVGLINGVMVHGLALGDAFRTYTILTVGDGLVSQVPALIVSVAAGLLVSKGGMKGRTGAALGDQLGSNPKAFGMVAGLMAALALVPGLPFLPFFGFAALAGVMARRAQQAEDQRAEQRLVEEAASQTASQVEAAEDGLAIDSIRIDLGYGLLAVVNDPAREFRLDEQVKLLRRQLAADLGFVLPAVRIVDNITLKANEYVITVKEIEAARAELRPDRLLVLDPGGAGHAGLPGEPAVEPVFGMRALWIEPMLREEAGARGLTSVDSTTIIATHLAEVVKDSIGDLLSFAAVQQLLSGGDKPVEKLAGELVPSRISLSSVQRVLQNLLAEGVSIRDLSTILEGIADAVTMTQNVMLVTEHVRARLARQISASQLRDGAIPVVTLSGEWDEEFSSAIIGQGEERHLAMAPSRLQGFIAATGETFDRLAAANEMPCILTSPALRPFVRSIVERVRPATVVLSQNEIHPRSRIRSLGTIG